jgi:hypothetical protein
MERKLAHIEQVHDIRPIEGADRIVLIHVLGWQLIALKDEFKEGDLAVYIEIDSRVPSDMECFSFLSKRNYKVKTIKMKGCLSQGLALPLSILPKRQYSIGDDVSKILKITKIENDYIPPTQNLEVKLKQRHNKLYKNRLFKYLMKFEWFRKIAFKVLIPKKTKDGSFPTKFEFVHKTDENRIQNVPDLLIDKTPLTLTEKIEGSSATYILERIGKKFKFYVCSRNVLQGTPDRKCFYDDNIYWIIANKYNIKEKLEEYLKNNKNLNYVCLQAEIVGPGICGNIYSLKEYDAYVFNVINSIDGRLNSLKGKDIIKSFDMKFVPILDIDFVPPDTVDEMLDIANGKSKLADTLREGVVARGPNGETKFKAVSNEYLLKRGY